MSDKTPAELRAKAALEYSQRAEVDGPMVSVQQKDLMFLLELIEFQRKSSEHQAAELLSLTREVNSLQGRLEELERTGDTLSSQEEDQDIWLDHQDYGDPVG